MTFGSAKGRSSIVFSLWCRSSSKLRQNKTSSLPSPSSSHVQSKRVRGPSKGKALHKHVRHHGQIQVVISPGTTRPRDLEAPAKFSRACSSIARAQAPIKGKRSWKDIEPNKKEPLDATLHDMDERPGRIDFFGHTQTSKKTRQFCSMTAQSKYDEMKERQMTTQAQEFPLTKDEIYDDIMGVKAGYVKRLRQGPKPMKGRPYRSSIGKETQELREKIVNQDERIESLQRINDGQAKQLEEQAKQLEEMSFRQSQLEAFVRQLVQEHANHKGQTIPPFSPSDSGVERQNSGKIYN